MAQEQFRPTDYNLGLSRGFENPYNQQIAATATSHMRVLTDEDAPSGVPELGTLFSSTKTGSGNEFETGHDTRGDYWGSSGIKVNDQLNTEIGGTLFHQALSGGLTDTVVTTGQSHDHEFAMLTDAISVNQQPLSRNGVIDCGSEKHLFTGMCVEEFGVGFEGEGMPTFDSVLMGSGFNKNLADITPAIALPALESQFAFNYLHSANALIQFTGADFGGSYTVSSSSRFRGLSFRYKNNLKFGGRERQPNDQFLVAGDPKSGAYQNRLRYGMREGSLQFALLLDHLGRERKAANAKRIMTNMIITLRGGKIGTSNDLYELSIIIPKFRIDKTSADVIDGDEVVRCDIKFLKDTVTSGLVRGRVRNGVSAGIIPAT